MFNVIQFLHQCRVTNNLSAIKKLHAHLLTKGILFTYHDFHTQLIATYASCLPENKNLQALNNFFKCMNSTNPLHFNVMISDFHHKGFPFLSLTAFSFMHTNAIPLDTYALCTTLTASSKLKDVIFGKQIHAHVAKSGWSSSVFVGSALIDFYSKLLSNVKDAALVFDEIPEKNTVCANALLSGYGEAGLWTQELELLRKMPVLNLQYDHFTFSAALRACTGLSSVEMGMQLHSYILRIIPDIESDVFLQSALIEMYGKCGVVKKAWQIFKLYGMEVRRERRRDVVLWTSMLGVYGRNGKYKEVIDLYNEMLKEGIKPDGIAFLTVISACVHTGQVDDGVKYFESMTNDFKLDPSQEHYNCLVDLLCKAGELDKAWELLNGRLYKGMVSCTISMWGALLSGCVDRGNIELGRLAAQRALELDPQHAGICIMLSKLYARFGMWDEIGRLRLLINERGLRKDVGCSWLGSGDWLNVM